jgi:hypothetical protein
MFKTEVGEYKGSKTLSIMSDDRRIISFGINKAKAILASIDEIRQFVEGSEKNSVDFSSLSEEQKKLVMQFINK